MIEIPSSSGPSPPLALVPLITSPLSIIQTYINCQQREQKQRHSYVDQPDHLEGWACLWTSLKFILAAFSLIRLAILSWAFFGLVGFLDSDSYAYEQAEKHLLLYLRVGVIAWMILEGFFLLILTAFFNFLRAPLWAALYALQTALATALAISLEVWFFNAQPPYWIEVFLIISLFSLLFHLAHNLIVRVDQHHLRSMTALRGSFFGAILKV